MDQVLKDNQFKIIAIPGSDIRYMGGGEEALLNLCNIPNIKCTILSVTGNQDLKLNQESRNELDTKSIFIKTIRLEALKFDIPIGLVSRKIPKLIKNADYIFTFSSNIFSLLFLKMWSKYIGSPIILFLHDPFFFHHSNSIILRIYNNMQRFLIRKIPIIHVETYSQKQVIDKINCTGKVVQFPLFFPRNIITFSSKPPTFFEVLFVGRLSTAQKGIDLLCQIISEVIKMEPKVNFRIVGSGIEGELLVNELQKTYPENVRMLGYLSRMELEKEFRNASLFIFTSRWETLGLTVLEALNWGLPTVSFNIDGPSDFISIENGVLIDNFDIISFASAIISYYHLFLNDPLAYADFRLNVSSDFTKKFGAEKTKANLLTMLQTLKRSNKHKSTIFRKCQ